jgi:hypothetical protein
MPRATAARGTTLQRERLCGAVENAKRAHFAFELTFSYGSHGVNVHDILSLSLSLRYSTEIESGHSKERVRVGENNKIVLRY